MKPIHKFVRTLPCVTTLVLLSGCVSEPPVALEALPPEPVSMRLDPAEFSLRGLMTSDADLESLFVERLSAGSAAVLPEEIDAYLDAQESRLRSALAASGITVYDLGDYITVRLPVGSVFSLASADLDPAEFGAVEVLASVINDYGSCIVEIASHTAASGSERYDVDLSARRARSIANALQALDVDSERILEVAAGSAHPVAPGSSFDGRMLNRRIELNLIPVRDLDAERAAAAAAAAALAASQPE